MDNNTASGSRGFGRRCQSAAKAQMPRLAAVRANAAPFTSLSPTADRRPLRTAADLNACAHVHAAVVGDGSVELGRSRVGVGDSGISYAARDVVVAVSYVAFGGAA